MRLFKPIPRSYNELRRNTWKYIPTVTLDKNYGIFFLKKKLNIKIITKKNKKLRNKHSKKKNQLKKKKIGKYNLTITITNNNTFINFSKINYKVLLLKKNKKKIVLRVKDKNKTLVYLSGGLCGFAGSQKCTPEANTTMASSIADKINNLIEKKKRKEINIFLKGRRRRAKTIIKQLVKSGLLIKFIKKITPYPFNGCRAKKKRRL